MSLETVVDDILDDARKRAEEIREEGEQRAGEIRADAEEDAAEIIETAKEEVEQQIEQEREQKVSNANLEAKRMRLNARRAALNDVHETVEERITAINGDTREELTQALLESAAREFSESETVLVYGRPEDSDVIESLLTDHEGLEYAGEYDCLGGVVVESESSRIRVNNTFDSILEDVWEDLLPDVSAQLFDQ